MTHRRSCLSSSGPGCVTVTRLILVSASGRPDMPEVMDPSRDVRHMRRRVRSGHTLGMPKNILVSLRDGWRVLLVAGAVVAGTIISAARPASAQAPQGGPDIIASLKATPGVLGVEAARTQS